MAKWNRIGGAMALGCATLLAACAGPMGGGPSRPQAPRIYSSLEEVPLIPRDVLFGNPDRAAVRLSPDGRHLSFLAPLDGVLNVWVAPATAPAEARPITNDRGRGIRSYFWAWNNRQIVYIQDKDGDENWRVYGVDVESAEARDLTPLEGVRAQILEVSRHFPDQILVGLNDRDPRFHDVYRVSLSTGERELLVTNDQEFAGFVTDDQYEIRFATRYRDDGSYVYFTPGEEPDDWQEFFVVPPDDTFNTSIWGFDRTGRKAYLVDSRNRNTGALTLLDLETGDQELIAEDPRADIGGVMLHPTDRNVQAVSFTYDRREFIVLDDAIRTDIGALQELERGELSVISRTLEDRLWVAAYIRDDGPVEYYLWDRDSRTATYLFSNQTSLEGLPLACMDSVIFPSRDGLNLVSYLTLPLHVQTGRDGRPRAPQPMVLLVHGGPWGRDGWGFHAEHQFWANRGYAVLSVNFRGSTGFGKDFVNAGDKQWGAAMHDDLVDAVKWAVAEGIADPDKVAIKGGSYGGYAALVGLTMTPELFAAGVSVVGPSNLVTLLESIPPYWTSGLEMFRRRVGDHTTDEGRAFLMSRSPLTYVDRIQRPLLIGQGANDPRVKQAESDQIVEAMTSRGIPVTYVLYPDEGHGFARPENRISFTAVTEAFLSEHLGGRFEPIGGSFEGATITVPAGAEDVPGLHNALDRSTGATD